MIYVKIDRATGAELERADLGLAPGRALSKAVVWLPLVQQAAPANDPETTKLVPTRTLPAGLSDLAIPVPATAQCVDGWDTVPLTAAELLARRNAKIAALDPTMARVSEDLAVATLRLGRVPTRTDLPQATIDRLNARLALREEPPV